MVFMVTFQESIDRIMYFVNTLLIALALSLELTECWGNTDNFNPYTDINVEAVGTFEYKGVLYSVTDHKMHWLEASHSCQAIGGKLSTNVVKPQDILDIKKLSGAPIFGKLWTSLKRQDGEWKYEDGQGSDVIPREKSTWVGPDEDMCSALEWQWDNTDGHLSERECDDWAYGLCQFGEKDPRWTPQIDSLRIRGVIVSRFAETVVTSIMKNPSIYPEEVEFTLLIPASAFITNLTMVTKEATIVGSVVERERAQGIYDLAKTRYLGAKGQGNTVGIVVSRGISFKVFKTSMLVAPQENVAFELTYQQFLSKKNGVYDYSVSVNPKQIVKKLSLNVDMYETSPFTKVKVLPMDVEGEVLEAQKAGKVTKNFLVETENYVEGVEIILPVDDPTTCQVTYSPTMSQQQELSPFGLSGVFTLQYNVIDKEIAGRSIVQNGYFAHFFVSPFPPQPRAVVLILDTSQSMDGHRETQAKQAIVDTLATLNDKDYFNVITFGALIGVATDAQAFDNMVIANEDNIKLATRFVNNADAWGNLEADAVPGFTRAFNTIQAFLPDGGEDEYKQLIIAFTAGYFHDPEAAVNLVKDTYKEGSFTWHSLAFGTDADIPTLNEIASITGGRVEQILGEMDASAQVGNFLDEAVSSVMHDLEFHYSRKKIADVVGATQKILRLGEEFVVTGRLLDTEVPNAKSPMRLSALPQVQITGYVGEDKHTFPIVIDPTSTRSNDLIDNMESFTEKLWALKRIKELLFYMELTKDIYEKEELKEKALGMSLDYNLLTTLTSLIVMKPEEYQIIEESYDDSIDIVETSIGAVPLGPMVPIPADVQFGIEANRRGIATIYADPHITIPLDNDLNMCLNLKSDENQQVITLLHDSRFNHSVNTMLTVNGDSGHTYMTSVSIIDFTRDFSIMINLDQITLYGSNRRFLEEVSTSDPLSLRYEDLVIVNNPKHKMMIIKGYNFEYHVMFKRGLPFSHLDFFIHDYDCKEKSTQLRGVVGEFLHQPATIEEKPKGHYININGMTSHVLEKHRFSVKGDNVPYEKVSCWFVNSWQFISKHPFSENIREELMAVPDSYTLTTNDSSSPK